MFHIFDNYDDGDGYDGNGGTLSPAYEKSPVLWRNVYFRSVLPSVVVIQREATYWDFIKHNTQDDRGIHSFLG